MGTEAIVMRRYRHPRLLAIALALTAFWLVAAPAAAQHATPLALPAPAGGSVAPAVVPPVTVAPATPPPKIDSGDTAWMLTSAALVLMMTAPGLALFYGGMVRRHNVLGTIMQSFILMAVISIQWVLWGYSVSFGPDVHGLIGNLSWIGLNGVGLAPNPDYAATIPHQAFMIYQLMFAIITPALITGAFAERIKFSGFLVFTVRAAAVSALLVRYNAGGVPASIGTQTAGVPFPVMVDAVDRFGNATDTTMSVSLTDSSGYLSTQVVSVVTGRGLVAGLVMTRSLATTYLQAADGHHTGRSNSFAVSAAQLDHFFFQPLPSVVIANHPFAARIEGRDAYENTADTFNGTAAATDASGKLVPTSLPFVSGVWAGTFNIPDPMAQDSIAVFASSRLGRSSVFQVQAQGLAGFEVGVGAASVARGARRPSPSPPRPPPGWT
jgi:hypothetical protein